MEREPQRSRAHAAAIQVGSARRCALRPRRLVALGVDVPRGGRRPRVRLLPPPPAATISSFIGNWGDDERTRELDTFLFEPARALGLTGHVHGVRYPLHGVGLVEGRCTSAVTELLAAAGLQTIASRHTCDHRVDELMRS